MADGWLVLQRRQGLHHADGRRRLMPAPQSPFRCKSKPQESRSPNPRSPKPRSLGPKRWFQEGSCLCPALLSYPVTLRYPDTARSWPGIRAARTQPLVPLRCCILGTQLGGPPPLHPAAHLSQALGPRLLNLSRPHLLIPMLLPLSLRPSVSPSRWCLNPPQHSSLANQSTLGT